MKKVLIVGGIALMMMFAGCSSKTPSVGEGQENASEQTTAQQPESAAEADTVVVDENGGVSSMDEGAADAGEQTMSDIEKRFKTIYFAFDKFDISPEASEKLMENSDLANGAAADYNIKIEGNCDEWGSDEYNFALGLKRAKAAKDVMVANGVNEDRITMVSYGESNPVCMEKTKECWAKNRRDDFKLLP